MSNPYANNLPESRVDLPVFDGRPPQVVFWYKVYSALMALLYLVCTVLFSIMIFVDPQDEEMPRAMFVGMMVMMTAMCLILLAMFAAGLFLPAKPWVWIYGIVLICIGLTSCCTLPFCIAMLVYWLKPETKMYFGRRP